MSVRPPAEVFEELKRLRREGDSRPLDQLLDDARQALRGPADTTISLIRTLEIRALADRVFADPAKAEGWLSRPNRGLNGQRPMDLLRDELGAAVVREELEQIDHGIFA
jgi:putative toxin-antitoxin system antitoxin component (TIGR02293 family)